MWVYIRTPQLRDKDCTTVLSLVHLTMLCSGLDANGTVVCVV